MGDGVMVVDVDCCCCGCGGPGIELVRDIVARMVDAARCSTMPGRDQCS